MKMVFYKLIILNIEYIISNLVLADDRCVVSEFFVEYNKPIANHIQSDRVVRK